MPLPERLLGAVGLLLVLSVLTFLGYQAVFVRDGGPELRTSVVGVEETVGGQFVVRYEVTNDGGITAESVTVVGELVRDGQQLEQVTSTVAYVPVESSRTGGLVFDENPSRGALRVRVASYTRP